MHAGNRSKIWTSGFMHSDQLRLSTLILYTYRHVKKIVQRKTTTHDCTFSLIVGGRHS